MLAYWAVRQGEDWQWPPIAHRGPKVMLINGWSGSGGDAFPFYFREAKVGPLVGTRTWGGLIGLSGSPDLIDGGGFTVPTFRMYDARGTWFREGVGVEPDIRVDENPTELAKGVDPQLEARHRRSDDAAEDGATGAAASEVRAPGAAARGSGRDPDGGGDPLGAVNSQLPTSNCQGTPKLPIPKAHRPSRTGQGWELGIGSALEVGSRRLEVNRAAPQVARRGTPRRPARPSSRCRASAGSRGRGTSR